LRGLYHAVFTHQPELQVKWANKKVPATAAPPRFGHNFLEENLNEAFIILDECRRALTDAQVSTSLNIFFCVADVAT
jgi:hypothetical protein